MQYLLKEMKFKYSGEVVRFFRKNFKITSNEFATLVGLGIDELEKIEAGKKQVELKIALAICAIFDISLENLLFPNGVDREKDFIEALDRAKVFFKTRVESQDLVKEAEEYFKKNQGIPFDDNDDESSDW
ncbi:helix-turn-helix transcriptional regulator [Halobacteriovorax sp. RZ-1]|uniref:helix-turn-helix domain-containing protein n=1 Tax=unclassified Halobacteriovorax TaxID=2639665 RepID=UPI0037139712